LRTAIVSDLHLGSGQGEDLLRDTEIRRALLEQISRADRLVLLGDALETREGPLPDALAAARPFFEALGEAMGGREVLLVPGNHDHRLAEPLLEDLAQAGEELGLEHLADPGPGPGRHLAEWLGPARLRLSYPGVWLREDVYATHGHYMDCHMTLPRMECVAAAALVRLRGPLPDRARPLDYERVLRPVYGFSFGLAQGGSLARRSARPSERAWHSLFGSGRRDRSPRARARRAALGAGIRTTIWSLNRALRSEFAPEISTGAITASGIAGATEMSRRLELGAAHVIVGHTHRAGPRPEEAEWPLAGGGRLHNTGCWTFTSALHQPGTPPGAYWPGTLSWLQDDGPPQRVSLLAERSGESLRAIVRRQRQAAPTRERRATRR
jgi:UDP-2,3-diacylglucosamine pyrophosphatase LpxH